MVEEARSTYRPLREVFHFFKSPKIFINQAPYKNIGESKCTKNEKFKKKQKMKKINVTKHEELEIFF